MDGVSRAIGRIRSALYVPGHRDRMVAKAVESEADCIYFDLEDSVPPDEKARARSIGGEAVQSLEEKVAFVRVNDLDSHLTVDDVQAVYSDNLDGVLLPKSNSPEAVVIAEYLLSVAEDGGGRAGGPVAIGVLAETASTIVRCREILSASARVASVSVGVAEDGDLQADVGYTRTGSRHELLYLMSHVLVIARSLGIENVLSGRTPSTTTTTVCAKRPASPATWGSPGRRRSIRGSCPSSTRSSRTPRRSWNASSGSSSPWRRPRRVASRRPRWTGGWSTSPW